MIVAITYFSSVKLHVLFKKTILITGARAPIALELSRSFAMAGHRVIMADSQHFTVARWSNSVFKYIIFPSPAFRTAAFVNKLKNIISEFQVDHLIPTCEEAFYISAHLDELNCRVWTSPIELMNQLHNKSSFISIAAGHFNVPQTINCDEFTDWNNCTNYVFKKIYSRFGTSVIIDAEKDVYQVLKNNTKGWIAQQRITGKEVCVYSIWEQGRMKAFACYHPLLRYGKGAGIFFEPVFNDKIMHSVVSFGEAISYNGQLSFDIIIKDEMPYVIECNPRGTSGAHLLNKSLCKAFLGTDLHFPVTDKTFCIGYAMLLKYPELIFSKKVKKANDVIFAKHDPAPFFLQTLSLLEIFYLKLIKKQTVLQVTTGDIEWNGPTN